MFPAAAAHAAADRVKMIGCDPVAGLFPRWNGRRFEGRNPGHIRMHLLEFLVAGLVLGGTFVVLEVAYQAGLRSKPKEAPPQLSTVQGAMLGLLGLLLGFSFSGATGRFIDRQDIVVQEGNAIGTAYLRADLLDEPHASALRTALRAYCDARITLFEDVSTERNAKVRAEMARLQADVWKAGVDGVRGKDPRAAMVLPPLNEVFDLLSTRDSVVDRHIPPIVLGLLCGCAAMSIATIGYGCGLQRRRGIATVGGFALLIAVALWVTIDFDYPRRGLIKVSDRPLVNARAAMEPAVR